ncbi:MAG: four-carbon acid sugar kinase family protein [Rubellimicrobium sp.]|nr:four-carbon acid sugar kinase family protein [Rubellimicrobium sp.]
MTGALPPGLLLAAYGDDFTGSAATMEVMAFAGLPTTLFLDLPTPDRLARFPDLRGIVLAGTARAKGTDWMRAHLPRIFDRLAGLGAQVLHYKVCSTLDSAPDLGSIGRAIDIALDRIPASWVPVLVAAPPLRRYQCFGHLFASAPGGVFRLDRHPVMARHPVTPMDESDVALHLSRQTDLPIGLIDLEALGSPGTALARLEALRTEGRRIVALDALGANDLATCGALIWGSRGAASFCVGSQGVEYALIAHWRALGLLPPAPPVPEVIPAGRIVVVSGSVSPVTAAQIDHASARGFAGIALDTAALIAGIPDAEEAAVGAALAALSQGRDPLVYSARGPDDPAIAAARAARDRAGLSAEEANARIGRSLGQILGRILSRTGLTRAVISGGDPSGEAPAALGVFALSALAPTIAGAPLLRAHAEAPRIDGLELALKGGQMGTEDYFTWLRDGRSP